ncbi:MAG TPA: carbohydrate binding domain-containing protein, partial [Anaerolineae bacterium]|nr:carbohydrate binding domain-containing protein [Anaerolineae bacterium]
MKAKSTLIPILVALLVAVAPLASLSATSLSVAPSASSAAPLAAGGVNLIVNGDFSAGMTAWWSYGVTTDASSGDLQVTMPGGLVNPYDAGVGQDNIAVLNGTEYRLKFDASADTNVSIHVVVQNPDTFHNYIDQVVNLTSTPTTFTYTFVADEDK